MATNMSSQIEHNYYKFICGPSFVGDVEKKRQKTNLGQENYFLLVTYWNVASISFLCNEWGNGTKTSKIQTKEQLSLKWF